MGHAVSSTQLLVIAFFLGSRVDLSTQARECHAGSNNANTEALLWFLLAMRLAARSVSGNSAPAEAGSVMQRAFDQGQLFFNWPDKCGAFVMRILDPVLANTTLSSASTSYPQDNASTLDKELADKTFGNLEGQSLVYTKGPAETYKRCLMFHGRLAIRKAVKEQWIQPGQVEVNDNWSKGSYQEKVDMYFSSME